jgi:hypothetical protein
MNRREIVGSMVAADVTRIASCSPSEKCVNPALPGWTGRVILNFSQKVTFRYTEHDLLTVVLIFIP